MECLLLIVCIPQLQVSMLATSRLGNDSGNGGNPLDMTMETGTSEMSRGERAVRVGNAQTLFESVKRLNDDEQVGLVEMSAQSLAAYYMSHPEYVPFTLHDGLPEVVRALLRPSVEEALIQDFGKTSLKRGSPNPRVFMPEDFLKVANLCLSPDLPTGTHAVEMNLGVTTGKPNPTMLAYFMLALNRYADVIKSCEKVGFAPGTIPVRLRLFSTVGSKLFLEEDINEQDVRRDAAEQERWVRALIAWLYPEIASSMPTFEIANFPLIDPTEHQSNRQRVARVLKDQPELKAAITRLGERHGGAFLDFFSNDYLAYHLSKRTFRDGDLSEPAARISIGGPSEVLFNRVRMETLRFLRGKSEETPLLTAITSSPKVVCQSPPYLDRDSLFTEGPEIGMTDFISRSTHTAMVFNDPSRFDHPTRCEWMLVGETVARIKDLDTPGQGVSAYHQFFNSRILSTGSTLE